MTLIGRHGPLILIVAPARRRAVEMPALHGLPGHEARHADDQIGNALDQRQRQRRFRRHAEDRAQHDQPALLGAERAGHGEGRAAHRVHQAFDDDGLARSRSDSP